MTQRRFRLPAILARTLTALGLVVAMGGTVTAAADSTEPAGPPEGGVSADTLAELQAEVDAAQEVPEWAAQGAAFSVADLAGQRILSMPVSSQLEGCDRMAREIVDIAKSLGMTDSTYFQNDGGPAAWIQGMELAINQGYDGVALVCGIDPAALAPQMQAARDAGIEVVDLHLADVSDPASELIAAQTNGEFNRAMRMGVYSALIDSGGEPIDALVLTSNENPPSVGMEQTVFDEFARLCEACNVESVNVPIPEWATRLPTTVNSALVANPELDAIFMVYDAMTPQVIASIAAAGAPTRTYAFGADRAFVPLMLEDGSPIASDMGPNFSWMAYSGADQLFRVLVGEDPIPAAEAYAPYRMFTPANAAEHVPPDDGFGDAYIEGYRSLWLDAPES